MRTSLALLLALTCCRSDPAPRTTAPPGAGSAVPVARLPPEPVPLGPLPADTHPVRQALTLRIDPARDRFGGSADLTVRLDRPRDVIWLHGRGLTVSAVTVAAAGAPPVAARYEEVDPIGVASVSVPAPVTGEIAIHIEYEAAFDPQLVGAYKTVVGGAPAVFTKFEAIYARRAFPCFDEPAFKIPFDVALQVPGNVEVIANMPVADTRAWGAERRLRFATTPPLPTYLIAWAIGPFAARAATVAPSPLRQAPLPLRAVAWRGRERDTAFALATTPALLAEQERYFGIAFPYPKLDLIAVPDFQSGAMENAGAITFRDSALLVDDKVTSLDQRIRIVSVIAHEVAHQWFGDLVTMRWWDDLWLNEGFATWMATRTLRVVRPELEAELDAVAETNAVMNADSLATARRIRQPIESSHDITNAFDGITYDKGAALLTMLEHHIGDEVFRRGVHAYLTAHALGNATTDQLLEALSHEAGRDLAPLAASFLDQPGVPVIHATPSCVGGKGRVAIEQARWQPIGAAGPRDATWQIPVCVRAGIGPRTDEVCALLGERAGVIELPGCADWVMPNAQAAGYYRFTLPAGELARLRDRGTPRLTTAERLSLAHNLDAALRSAALPAGDVLRALEALARDRHGTVAATPLGVFGLVDDFMVDGAGRAALRARLSRLYAPAVAALGWKAAPNEPPSRRLFRSGLLGFLAAIDDPAVAREAGALGRKLLGVDGDGALHPEVVDADLADTVLAAAARRGDAGLFDALVAAFARSSDAQLRQRLLLAIGRVREPALVARALELSLDPRLRQNERLFTLAVLLGTVETRDAAWAWLKDKLDTLLPLLPDRYGGFLPRFYAACDRGRADELRALFTPRIDQLTGGPRNLAQAIERAEQCAARVAAQRDSVQSYLRGR